MAKSLPNLRNENRYPNTGSTEDATKINRPTPRYFIIKMAKVKKVLRQHKKKN